MSTHTGDRHLHSVPPVTEMSAAFTPEDGGDTVSVASPATSRLSRGNLLAPLALISTVVVFGGALAGRAVLLSGGGQPKGVSVEELEADIAKGQYVYVTPRQRKAVKGSSEVGAMVDPWVYRGTHSNITTERNLNTVITMQDPSKQIHAGFSYKVPYLKL